MRAFSAFTQRTIRRSRLVAWPAAESARAPGPTRWPTPGRGTPGSCASRPPSTPPRCGGAASGSRTRPAASLPSPLSVDEAPLALSALDLHPPSGSAAPGFDAVEARFASRSAAEAEAELAPCPGRGCGRC